MFFNKLCLEKPTPCLNKLNSKNTNFVQQNYAAMITGIFRSMKDRILNILTTYIVYVFVTVKKLKRDSIFLRTPCI